MLKKLTIRAFFFNAKTDYLPYYKNFAIKIDTNLSIESILEEIKIKNSDFSYPSEKLLLKVNHLVVEANEKISNIVTKLGTNLQIDPVSSYHSTNGLIINDSDFMTKFDILEPFADADDLLYYKSLYAIHYASETFHYDKDYIGDAILLLASHIIEKDIDKSEEVLKAITDQYSGLLDCEYENNLLNEEEHTQTIAKLKLMVVPTEEPSLFSKIKSKLKQKKDDAHIVSEHNHILDDIESKHIAYYSGKNIANISNINSDITQSNATIVKFSKSTKLSGISILKDNKNLALKKVGVVLFDAYDSGAEILVIDDKDVFTMINKHIKTIEKIAGRGINMEFIDASSFQDQVRSLKTIEIA